VQLDSYLISSRVSEMKIEQYTCRTIEHITSYPAGLTNHKAPCALMFLIQTNRRTHGTSGLNTSTSRFTMLYVDNVL